VCDTTCGDEDYLTALFNVLPLRLRNLHNRCDAAGNGFIYVRNSVVLLSYGLKLDAICFNVQKVCGALPLFDMSVE